MAKDFHQLFSIGGQQIAAQSFPANSRLIQIKLHSFPDNSGKLRTPVKQKKALNAILGIFPIGYL